MCHMSTARSGALGPDARGSAHHRVPARAHGVDVDAHGARRRPSPPPGRRWRTSPRSGRSGCWPRRPASTTALVRRPLGDVLADADPSYPWLALRRAPTASSRRLRCCRQARGGARVVVPGAHARPARWSLASLQAWFGVSDDRTAVDWILAEPAAPLSPMRSPAAAPPRRRRRDCARCSPASGTRCGWRSSTRWSSACSRWCCRWRCSRWSTPSPSDRRCSRWWC